MTTTGATIVSAFMTNINFRGDRSYEKYIELASHLLRVPINKVIFVDSTVYSHFKQFNNDNTIIVPFYKESNYLYNYKNIIDNTKLSTTNPQKDTVEYMMTMCYKTEFVRSAIQMNLFNSTQYIWMDLGIKHMMTCKDDEFVEKVMRLKDVEYKLNHVRIPSIWNPDNNYQVDIYKDLTWYFAGSLFGGNSTILIKFADLVKETCLKVIHEKNILMWEINIWQLVYRMDRWRFLYYFSGHNNSILDSY
jgi:hypothetical protein